MKYMCHFLLTCLLLLNLSCKDSKLADDSSMTSSKSIEVFNDIDKVEPPNWWVGFKNQDLQLMVHHDNISTAIPEILFLGVSVKAVQKADSPNYLFIDLHISNQAKAGRFNIVFKFEEGETLVQTYELKEREKAAVDFIGFDSSDAIYLITPDRFANGDVSNDTNEPLLEKTIDRTDDYARHGGDLKGIIDHLDYIYDLGFTAIWPTPMLINDMPKASYHGYAMTDFYKVDPRFGTLENYKELSSKMAEKDMKLIMDMVANHCGSNHWWMRDLPFKDWVNQQQAFLNGDKLKNSNHRRTTNQDSYASKVDKNEMTRGWFVPSMPDLNQKNPFMANYIIQNNIWWIETLKLGGIRQDTYPYSDKEFLSNWAGSIMTEYPNFNIVGEEWTTNPLLIAYWQDGHQNKDGYDSNLKSTMDFAMQSNIVQALNENESWGGGLVKMYDGLANDFVYTNPKSIMIFPDNHDMSRIFTQLKGDVANTKMALATILTLPRIPQLYYGTEILMNDFEKPGDHGLLRGDFPGGWQGDQVNAFTGDGLTDAQTDMQSYLKTLLNYRKTSKAIHEGKTLHFAPENGIYVLFRSYYNETVVLILNKNTSPITLDLKRYEEAGLTGKTLKNIVSGKQLVWDNTLELNQKGSLILTTKID
ncbi:glycoside hydrolase family 13 protein [Flavobacteriaceae bacterium LMO-SS05]